MIAFSILPDKMFGPFPAQNPFFKGVVGTLSIKQSLHPRNIVSRLRSSLQSRFFSRASKNENMD